MNIRLVALDIDDTLVDHSSIIPQRSLDALRKAQAQGVEILFDTECTGLLIRDGACQGVTIRGAKYGAEDVTLTNAFPLGVSNEFIIDEEAEITVEDGTLLITVFWGQ